MIELKLANEGKVKTTLVITDGQIVSKDGEILSKEIVRFRVLVKIRVLKNKKRKVTWKILAVENDYLNVEEDDIDDFDKSLLGVSIKFHINSIGDKIKIKKLKRAKGKIGENMKKIIDENVSIGMDPNKELETECFLKNSFQFLYKDELKKYIKKFHERYGEELPLEREVKREGIFNRKLAKEPTPAIELIKTELIDNRLYKYRLFKQMDNQKVSNLFKKKSEDFFPFDKSKIRKMFENNSFGLEYKESINYNKEIGIIELYEKRSISIMDGKKTESILAFEYK